MDFLETSRRESQLGLQQTCLRTGRLMGLLRLDTGKEYVFETHNDDTVKWLTETVR